jgi:hypothetical protein
MLNIIARIIQDGKTFDGACYNFLTILYTRPDRLMELFMLKIEITYCAV